MNSPPMGVISICDPLTVAGSSWTLRRQVIGVDDGSRRIGSAVQCARKVIVEVAQAKCRGAA